MSVLKHFGKYYHCARIDFKSFFALVIVLQVKIANTIFGCLCSFAREYFFSNSSVGKVCELQTPALEFFKISF